MTPAILKRLLLRELATTRRELEAYEHEADIWACPPGIQNSAGTLALHIAGNLQHFIGAQLGGTGYVRDRDGEFGKRDVPRAELDADLARAAESVAKTLDALDPARLEQPYALEVAGVRPPTGVFLYHLAVHLGYHLGQMDYHRRLVTGQGATVGALSVPALMEQ
jgi:hypothetical protein